MSRFHVRRQARCSTLAGALVVLSSLSLPDSASAQATIAAIVGVVSDSSGAVLPGVTVTAASPALQVGQLSGVTNERGEYRLSPLPVGTYTVAATRRMSGGWQSNASLSATRTNSPFDDRQALNPNSEINTANQYWEYTAKISGGYVLPFEVIASANYERRQGAPQARQHQFTGGNAIRSIVLNVEPIGSIRLPSTNLVDFRFAKRVHIARNHTLEGRFDFFNVFNSNFVTGRQLRSGSTYLVPSSIILPRILQMGVTYNF